MAINYALFRQFLKEADASRTEDWTKGLATVGGAAGSGAILTKYLPMSSEFAKKHPVLRGALYAGGLSAGGLTTRAAVDIARSMAGSEKGAGAPDQMPAKTTNLAQDFAAGLDPFGVYTSEFGQRAEQNKLEESEHLKKQLAMTAGGILGGGVLIPGAITGTIDGVKAVANTKGNLGARLAAGVREFGAGAVRPFAALHTGMKAKAALKRVAEGGTAGAVGRQAIKDTLKRAPIESLFSGGSFRLSNLTPRGMARSALPAVGSAVNANLAGIGLGAGVGGLGAYVQYAKGREAERDFEERIRQGAAQKLASNMPPFLKQDRPAKVKEIYRALRREHPKYSAEKKARIAIASGQKQASAPKLVGIPNMSDEEVRSIYNDFLRRANEQKQKMDSSSPGSLAHRWHSRRYKAHIADANSFVEKNASFTKNAEIEYRGRTFPGYNQPIDSDRPEKKKMVLAKKGDQVKLIHFGQKGYKHNYSDAAKKNYLTRSAGIRGKDGSLTANDKLSANYWARRELWPKNEPADGSAKNREKRASDDDLGHGMELAGLGILAAPAATHLGAKVPGVRKAAKPLSDYLKKNHSIEDAVELGGLGVLGVPAIKHFMDKRKKKKSS